MNKVINKNDHLQSLELIIGFIALNQRFNMGIFFFIAGSKIQGLPRAVWVQVLYHSAKFQPL